ncbi:MAG: hypothetical protein KC486_05620 [Myxococcales bacterium]|nr:hypothetical protein [Myxococcales bacterium]
MQSAAGRANATWNKFSAFRVLGDHEPMPGFRLVMRLAPTPDSLARLLSARAERSDALDSELARAIVRAGVGLLQSHFVSFAYATPEEIVALIRLDAVAKVGSSLAVYDRLVSMYSSRMAVLLGDEAVVTGSIYEFPDLGIAQRAFIAAQEWVEEATPLRSAWRVSQQRAAKGEAVDSGALATTEGQAGVLRAAGVDLEKLPSWWWRGIAARMRGDGGVELYDEVPSGADLASLIADE